MELKNVREFFGYTKSKMAYLLKISFHTYRRYEANNSQDCSDTVRDRLKRLVQSKLETLGKKSPWHRNVIEENTKYTGKSIKFTTKQNIKKPRY